MDLLRDLIRDLIGIIFPGTIVILFGIWFIYGLYSLFYPTFNPLTVKTSMDNLTISFIFLVLSYVAGQFLRTYQPGKVEKTPTKVDEKSLEKLVELSEEFKVNTEDKTMKQLIQNKIDTRTTSQGDMSLLYKSIRNIEEFPYSYRQKSRRLQGYPAHFNDFYDNMTNGSEFLKTSSFFEFCKSIIYEYSPSLKEEMLRETALIRLFTGLYYTFRFGVLTTSIVAIAHSFRLIYVADSFGRFINLCQTNPKLLEPSITILLTAISLGCILFYTIRRIPNTIKKIRQRETNIVYDGFYLLCQRHEVLKNTFDKRTDS